MHSRDCWRPALLILCLAAACCGQAEQPPAESESRRLRRPAFETEIFAPDAAQLKQAMGAGDSAQPLKFEKGHGLRIVSTGHSWVGPALRTLPKIAAADGYDGQQIRSHTGGGGTGSANSIWRKEFGKYGDAPARPILLPAIATGEWDVMTWGAFYGDIPEHYAQWIDVCLKANPEMTFLIQDGWPTFDRRLNELDAETALREIDRTQQRNQQGMFKTNYEALAEKYPGKVRIIPAGAAVVDMLHRYYAKELPGFDCVSEHLGGTKGIFRDGGHLSRSSGVEWLAGYVYYAMLYGKSPRLIKDFRPPDVSPELDEAMREAAWKAVTSSPFSGLRDDNEDGIGERVEDPKTGHFQSRPVPESLAAHFHPPAEYRNDFGGFRSPLTFRDGREVKSREDWAARREEILARWHELMGPWPPLIEKPQVEFIESEQREDFTQHRVRVEIAPEGRMVDGYLLVPEGAGDREFPAVVVVYYDAETGAGLGKAELRDFAYQLAKRGFVALSIGTPPTAYYPSQKDAQLQPLSSLAYCAANCYQALAGLPNVDSRRIGIVGHSYGGKWAMFASCLFDKFACAAWSDGGIVFDEQRANVNYWERWYLGYEPGRERPEGRPSEDNPRSGAYRELVEEGHDLHELHALMAPRPFLVSGGSEDRPERWRALNHSLAVNRLLGYENRVAMTNRGGHTPTEESNEQVYSFFEHFLMPPEGG